MTVVSSRGPEPISESPRLNQKALLQASGFLKARPGTQPLHVKNSLICMWMKPNFHMKRAPRLRKEEKNNAEMAYYTLSKIIK